MSNDYYNPSSWPATGAPGQSAPARTELASIATGFNKLPTLTANGGKAVVINALGTAMSVTAAALVLAVAFTATGAGAITLTSTGATNVTLPTTGTLATLAGSETFTNKTLTNPTINAATISGTIAGAATFSGALTLSSALTYGGVTLSNSVTGTGSMVLATSPTLTTPNIGVATGTSLNLGSGALTAGATSVTTLGASGLISATGGINMQGANTFSAASNAILAGVDSGNPHIFFVNSAGGVDEKVWDILVTSTQLQGRAVNDTNGAASNWLTVSRSGTTPIVSFPNGINGVLGATTPAAASVTTLTASDQITSTKTGQFFYASGATTSEKYLRLGNTGNDAYFGISNSTGGGIIAGATAYSTVLTTANNVPFHVGVNGTIVTTTSSTGLAVTGAVSATGVIGAGNDAGTTAISVFASNADGRIYLGKAGSGGNDIIGGNSAYAGVIGTNSSDPLEFGTNNAIRMTLDVSGNLTTTAPVNTNNTLTIAGSGSYNSFLYLKGGGGGGGAVKAQTTLYCYAGDQAVNGVYLVDGSATSWTSTSDERLKEIIEPISNAAEKVSSLRAVIGRYKTDDESMRRAFLIAQDVQAVLPEAVNKKGDAIGTLGLQYTDVIPLLVAAVNELSARLTAQESA